MQRKQQREPDYSSATSACTSSGKSGIKVTVLFDFDFFEKVEVMLEDMEEDDDEVVELEESTSSLVEFERRSWSSWSWARWIWARWA